MESVFRRNAGVRADQSEVFLGLRVAVIPKDAIRVELELVLVQPCPFPSALPLLLARDARMVWEFSSQSQSSEVARLQSLPKEHTETLAGDAGNESARGNTHHVPSVELAAFRKNGAVKARRLKVELPEQLPRLHSILPHGGASRADWPPLRVRAGELRGRREGWGPVGHIVGHPMGVVYASHSAVQMALQLKHGSEW